MSRWCYLTISSSVPHFSSSHQSFPAWGSFSMSWFFASSGQSIGASASTSVLPMSIQGWFPLGLTALISLLSRGLSRTFSSSTIWKHQFSNAQSSLWPNSHIHTMTTGRIIAIWTIWTFVSKVMPLLFNILSCVDVKGAKPWSWLCLLFSTNIFLGFS